MAATVRKATLADYDGFHRIAREIHEHHAALVPQVFTSAQIAVPHYVFARHVTSHHHAVFVAEEGGEIVGYAVVLLRNEVGDGFTTRTLVELENFGVTQTHRRGGVGHALFAACVAWGRQHGASSLELNCWEANTAALQFYASEGMHTAARWLALDI